MKLKKTLLCFVLIVVSFCFVSCKEKKQDNQPTITPQESVVTPKYSLPPYYVGDKLSTISIITSDGDTAGTIKWENEDYELVFGENSCKWVFTPSDTSAFLTKTGTKVINAVNRKQDPIVSNVRLVQGKIAYNEALCSTVALECDSNVDGTISFKNSSDVFEFGEKSYNWKFIPTDTVNYNECYGTVLINVTENQYITGISIKSNTKTSGFEYHDEYDLSGLVLNVEYNAGKVVTKTSSDSEFSITYNTGDFLRVGDTKVVLTYLDWSCDVVFDAVAKKGINKPTFTDEVVYDGEEHELSVAYCDDYVTQPVTGIDAGTYNLEATLFDPINCKWVGEDDDKVKIQVPCYILTAPQEVSLHNYSDEYDGEFHGSTVTSEDAVRIYYATTELNATNYNSGSLQAISPFKDAGKYTMYYYAQGDKNHNDAKGELSVEILQQAPNVLCEYCYSVKTGDPINYPARLVTVKDKQGNVLESGELTFTYYSTYSNDNNDTNDILTNAKGTAPINDKSTVYYVVVGYAGDNGNYGSSIGVAELFVDKIDNGFYGVDSNSFAFKDDVYIARADGKSFTLGGSNDLCEYYLEFALCEVDDDGLRQIGYTAKFGTGENCIKTGILIYKDGQYHMLEDGKESGYDLLVGENISSISLTIGGNLKTLNKWEIPKYLGIYTAQTVEVQELTEEHTSQISTINIYNDFGTIRFEMEYNVPFDDGYIPNGGNGNWSGFVEPEISVVEENFVDINCYKLNFYQINNGEYEVDSRYQYFSLYWDVTTDNPTSVNLIKVGGIANSNLKDSFTVLLTSYTKN